MEQRRGSPDGADRACERALGWAENGVWDGSLLCAFHHLHRLILHGIGLVCNSAVEVLACVKVSRVVVKSQKQTMFPTWMLLRGLMKMHRVSLAIRCCFFVPLTTCPW